MPPARTVCAVEKLLVLVVQSYTGRLWLAALAASVLYTAAHHAGCCQMGGSVLQWHFSAFFQAMLHSCGEGVMCK